MDFRREYLVRLPLPLAQLYGRAYNAKDARGRHDNAFYLLEAVIKLAAAPLVASYVHELENGAPRVPPLDRLLAQLALPSLGQWVAILRELSRHFGQRPDAASHPLGHVWNQLNQARRDLPAILALYRQIKNGPDGEPAGGQSCSLLGLFEALVQYRNLVFGHGAARFDAFYEQQMGPLLFPAINDLFAEGVFDLLGPPGSRLVYLTEKRSVSEGREQIALRELIGLSGERLAPLELSTAQAQPLLPNRMAVLWPGRPVPLRLDPLLLYRESELAEEVLFLNRDRKGRQIEYLSYTTGRAEWDKSNLPALCALLSRVTSRPIDEVQLQQLGEQSFSESVSVEGLFEPAAPQRVLGDYEILAELGRGGMGVVYLARQLSLGRLVALKMLPADLAGDEVALARFRREIRHLAHCEHPHIIKVLSSGMLPDGQLYYTMEYVPGSDLELVWRELAGPNRHGSAQTLGNTTWGRAVLTASRKRRDSAARSRQRGAASEPAETPTSHRADLTTPGRADARALASETNKPADALPDLPLPPLPDLATADDQPGDYVRRVAALLRDAALALQAVHEQGIIHRDVKPANLMLTPDSSRIVLMDFGLAKGQSLALSASRGGGFLGTLRYAAPEQLAAARLQVGPAADVRGLGVTLWELLTRRRLFGEAEDEAQLAHLIHEHDVPRLRSIDPALDRDLDAIVARATERRTTDRIPTAAKLAEYLQLYLDGQPLPIRPPSTGELLGRWVREHRALAGTFVALALLLIAVAVGSVWIAVSERQHKQAAQKLVLEIERQKDAANEEKEKAKAAEQLAKDQKTAAVRQSRISEVRRLAAESQSARSQFPVRSTFLAVEAYKRLPSDDRDLQGTVENELRECLSAVGGWPLPADANSMAISPDGRWLATGGLDGVARLWDLMASNPAASPRVLRGHKPAHWITCLAISPDGRWLATGSDDKTALLWDLTAADPAASPRVLRGHDLGVTCLAVSPDSRWLATGSSDKTARLWDLAASEPEANSRELPGHDDAIRTLAISPDGRWLVTGSWDTTVWLWDLTKPDLSAASHILTRHVDPIQCLAISPDSRWLATGSVGKTALLWDLSATDPAANPRELRGHEEGVNRVCVSPDAKWLATGSSDKTVRLWNLKALDPSLNPRVLRGHEDFISCLAISPDGRWVATGSNDKTVRLWDLASKPAYQRFDVFSGALSRRNIATRNPATFPRILRGHDGPIECLAISPDGHWLATGSEATTRLWDLTAPELRGHEQRIMSLAIGPDGRWLVTGSEDGIARIWDLTLPDPAGNSRVLGGHDRAISCLAISSDGRWMATGGDGRTARLWDLTATNLSASSCLLPGHGESISCLALTSDGHWLATGSHDKTARLWDLTANDPATSFRELRGHVDAITCLAVSRDGRWLATGSWDKTVHLWDLAAPDPAANSRVLKEHEGAVRCLAISPDGHWLATGSVDKTVRLWDLTASNPAANSRVLKEHEGAVRCLAISPDGHWLATGSVDKTGRIWDLTAPDPAAKSRVLRGHEDSINVVAFSPHGDWLATASDDATARLWDLVASEPSASSRLLRGHEGIVSCLAFSPNGHWLATGSYDNTARLWELRPLRLAALAAAVAGRPLTESERGPYRLDGSTTFASPAIPLLGIKDVLPGWPTDARWHERMATDAAAQGKSFAARFHARRCSPDSEIAKKILAQPDPTE